MRSQPATPSSQTARRLGTVLALAASTMMAGPAHAGPVLAEPDPGGSPAASSAAPAAARSAAAAIPVQKLDDLMEDLADAGAIGITAEVRRGNAVWASVQGDARLDPDRPAEVDARFRAASVTKQLVAVLALQLVEDGTWTLDTTIGEVAPGLWPGREAVTVRQLLSHTSGMPDYLQPMISGADTNKKFLDVVSKKYDDAELIAIGQAVPWAAEPGTAFTYSNTGYVVVGHMLEQATGRSISALVEKRILKPVGMRDSFFATGRALPGPRLGEYARLPGDVLDLKRFHPSMFSSAGALVSTASDLNDFQAALSAGDLIGRPMLRLMRAEVLADSGYGLGSYSIPTGCKAGPSVTGHDGGSWGTLTMNFSAGRNRQVTIAMTGRSYKPKQIKAQAKVTSRFLLAGLDASCGKRAKKAEADLADRLLASASR